MENKPDILPPGEHPNDPAKKDLDAMGFALDRVQTLLVWIDEHRASYEKHRNIDPESAENELHCLRVATRDALIYLQRLSELVLAGYTIDPRKRLPRGLDGPSFSEFVDRVVAFDKQRNSDAS
jgi:hypothetical protein